MAVPFLPRAEKSREFASGRRRDRFLVRSRAEAYVNKLVGYFNFLALRKPRVAAGYVDRALPRCSAAQEMRQQYETLTSRQRILAEALVGDTLGIFRSNAFFSGQLGRGASSLTSLVLTFARDPYEFADLDLRKAAMTAGWVDKDVCKIPEKEYTAVFTPGEVYEEPHKSMWYNMQEELELPVA